MFKVEVCILHSIDLMPLSVESYTGHMGNKEESKALVDKANKWGLHNSKIKPTIFLAEGVSRMFRILKLTQGYSLFSSSVYIPFININIDLFAEWIGDTMLNKVLSIRLIFHQEPVFYSALFVFSDEKTAKLFYELYNGKAFREDSPEYAILIFVTEVNYLNTEKTIIGESHNNITLQLPFCPLCLERIDVSVSEIWAVSSIFINLCSQTKKWKNMDLSCGTCKKIKLQELGCEYCAHKESVWVCLICSKVGCGRYLNGKMIRRACK
jgi:BRCA1-associated protein 2/Zn-finger in ubiquitin-hydrolases and other protein